MGERPGQRTNPRRHLRDHWRVCGSVGRRHSHQGRNHPIPGIHTDSWPVSAVADPDDGVLASLYAIGRALEPALGRGPYFCLYLLSALGGTLGVLGWVLIDPSSALTVTVGASGAIFGLFGSVFVLQRAAGIDVRAVARLLAVNLLYGFIVSGVSWQAHLGGLLFGMLATWGMLALGKPRSGMTAKKQRRRLYLGIAGMFLAELVILVVTYMVLLNI